VAVSYDAKANRLTIEGIDKQKVGRWRPRSAAFAHPTFIKARV